jgi:CMP-N-acetylneuraminic acid synthetase
MRGGSHLGNTRIIGIIPARGGSKGLPRKNVKFLAGKPLISWSIKAAQQSKLLTDYYVSTENKEISDIARLYDCKVIKRPARLASDSASVLDVCYHAARKTRADVVVLLQPTSPIRNPGLVDACIQRFLSEKADSLATGFMCKYIPYGTKKNTFRRQDYKGFFYDDGNVYVLKTDLLKRGLKKGRKAIEMFISKEQNVEIDDDYDFWLTEQIMRDRT